MLFVLMFFFNNLKKLFKNCFFNFLGNNFDKNFKELYFKIFNKLEIKIKSNPKLFKFFYNFTYFKFNPKKKNFIIKFKFNNNKFFSKEPKLILYLL